MEPENDDPVYCEQKAAEYRAKARAATDFALRMGLEAIAREYENRATDLIHRRGSNDQKARRT